MPEYQYLTEDGALLEDWRPGSECVPIGEWTEVDGVRCRRVCEGGAEASVAQDLHFKDYVTQDWTPGAKHYDSVGRPMFASRQELREFIAKHNDQPGKMQLEYHGRL